MSDEKPVVIETLDVQNYKRAKMVRVQLSPTGLTCIGGKCREGKTSILDAICAALGGEKYVASNPLHEGTMKGVIELTLSNGYRVKRTISKTGTRLTVTKPDGESGGQTDLNEFISHFALDLRKFLDASPKEQCLIFLKGIGVDLTPLDQRKKTAYDKREIIGREEKRKRGHAESLPWDADAGLELKQAQDVLDQIQEIQDINTKNAGVRAKCQQAKEKVQSFADKISDKKEDIKDLKAKLQQAEYDLDTLNDSREHAQEIHSDCFADVNALIDGDTSALTASLSEIETFNARVRKNLMKKQAVKEADNSHNEWLGLTDELKGIEEERMDLMKSAPMTLPELSVMGESLTYKSQLPDCWSHAETMKVAASIVKTIQPKMGFVLVDKLESMDIETFRDFEAFCDTIGLKVIGTRVSTGDENTIIIEDGQVKED